VTAPKACYAFRRDLPDGICLRQIAECCSAPRFALLRKQYVTTFRSCSAMRIFDRSRARELACLRRMALCAIEEHNGYPVTIKERNAYAYKLKKSMDLRSMG